MIHIGGQTLQEMSETQLKNLIPKYRNNQTVLDEIIRLLQIKSRIRYSDIRNSKKKKDPDNE
jgi:hypothetical protein